MHLYGPSNEFLGARSVGSSPGGWVYADVFHSLVGSGTYRCHVLWESWHIDQEDYERYEREEEDYYYVVD